MARKATAIFALAALALFSSGCMTWTRADLKTMSKPPTQGTPVLIVVKTSGERIEFSKSRPGHVSGDRVIGPATDGSPSSISIPLSQIRVIEYRKPDYLAPMLLVWLVILPSIGLFALLMNGGL